MIRYTDGEAKNVDNLMPGNQNVLLGTKIKEIQSAVGGVDADVTGVTIKPMIIIQNAITANATGGKAVFTANCPFALQILDVIVEARATSALGTVTVSTGGNAITDAIICAADNAVTRAGSIIRTYSTLAAGASLTLTTANANDRGLVTIVAVAV